MIYKIDKTNYKTFEIFEKNKLAPRAYFVPFRSAEEAGETDFLTERAKASRLTVLSGEWQFKYFPKVSLVPDKLDTDEVEFDTIKVPSCWQRTGYEPPVYLNVRYPFDTDPPNFPTDTSVGVYFKKFEIKDDTKRHIVTFLGVASCLDLYVNGHHVGYSEGSHNSAEFILDGYVGTGENELVAVVYKWCNGTYLEDQDMFRENGIFRDVYLTEYGETYINDFGIETEKQSADTYRLTLKAEIKTVEKIVNAVAVESESTSDTESAETVAEASADTEVAANAESETEAAANTEAVNAESGAEAIAVAEAVNAENATSAEAVKTEKATEAVAAEKASLIEILIELKKDGAVIYSAEKKVEGGNVSVTLDNLKVEEWSAEIPNLYELYLYLKKDGEVVECIRNYTGFKDIVIEDGVFKLNGKKIKVKGVNHHDSTPHGGYVITLDEMKRDILLMKEYNVNAVRTSHYPKDPVFVTLCDVYGLYVIDEADIETHGCWDGKKFSIFNTQPGMDRISDDPKWEKHYLDRVRRLYFKDRNHASIILWSLGNEAGGIQNQDACYQMLKNTGTKIPVHYEGARHTKRKHYDVTSTMYPFMFHVNNVVRGTAFKKHREVPYFFCEYAHAMGFGPGNLKEYVEAFYASDTLMGGCIWEFLDHSVIHTEEGAPYLYTYGGDHGETAHDGNFCVDGLFFPDRTPHTGALSMKHVYRPLLFERVYDEKGEPIHGEYLVKNTNRFLSSGYIDVAWTLSKNGEIIERGKADFDLKPEKSKKLTVAHKKADKNSDYHISFISIDKRDGHILSEEQIELSNGFVADKLDETQYKAELINIKGEKDITVKFKGGSTVFDRERGLMTSLKYKEKEYLNLAPEGGLTGFYPSVFRAPLDNDNMIKKLYAFWGTDKLTLRLKKITAAYTGKNKKERDEKKKVEIIIRYGLDGKHKLFGATVKYTIDGKGKITVTAKLTVDAILAQVYKNLTPIPRFGIEIELDKRFKAIEYYGRGPRETLPDIAEHAPIGIYRTTVDEMPEKYIKPQDSGNRSEIRYVKISDNKDNGIRIKKIDAPLSFNATSYSTKRLTDAKHQEDLSEKTTTNIRIDGFVRGTGSNSCGPWTLKKYTVNMNRALVFGFVIILF
ncbi:MAG: hypothetical protein LBT20_05945 [Clostridiales bacterium]|jgi:beta-galactosidase/beta-glucuronidase|nr:hypothetical protein [Clostridiales bacterium]